MGYVPSSPITALTNNTTPGMAANPQVMDDAVLAMVNTIDENFDSAQTTQVDFGTHKVNPVIDHPDGSVTATKIKDGNITTAKLANEGVTAPKIATRGITRDRISIGAVGYQELDPSLTELIPNVAIQAKFQSIDSQLKDIELNVKAYGADNTGGTSSSSAIAAAFAVLSAAGGGTLYFPPGRFGISTTGFRPPPNTYIRGAGKDVTEIFWLESDSTVDFMIRFEQNTPDQSSRISDLTLNQKRAERGLVDRQSAGVVIPQNNVTIERVRIINTVGPGITSSGIQNVVIRDCEIDDTGHHLIYFSSSGLGFIKNIDISNNKLGSPGVFEGRLLGANLIKFRFDTAGDLLQNISIKSNTMGTAQDEQGIFISTTTGGTSIIDKVVIEENYINEASLNRGMLSIIYIGANSVGHDISIKKNALNGSGINTSYGMRLLFSDVTNTSNVSVGDNTINNVNIGIDLRKTIAFRNVVKFFTWGIVGATGKAFQNTLESASNSAIGIRQATVDMIENVIILTGTSTVGIDMANSANLALKNNVINGATQGILRDAKSLTGCIFSENIFIACAANYVNFTNNAPTMRNNQFERSSAIQWGTTADRPANPYPFQLYGDTTIGKVIWWNGTIWVTFDVTVNA